MLQTVAKLYIIRLYSATHDHVVLYVSTYSIAALMPAAMSINVHRRRHCCVSRHTKCLVFSILFYTILARVPQWHLDSGTNMNQEKYHRMRMVAISLSNYPWSSMILRIETMRYDDVANQ